MFARVGAMKEWGATTTTPPTPGRVILSGHSGADIGMDQMLSGGKGPKNLGGIFLLDTLYDGAGHDAVVWKVSEKRLDQDLVRLKGMVTGDPAKDEPAQVAWVKAKGYRLFDTYVPEGFYDASAEALRKKKDAWLKKPDTRAVLGTPGSAVYDAVSANLVFAQGEDGPRPRGRRAPEGRAGDVVSGLEGRPWSLARMDCSEGASVALATSRGQRGARSHLPWSRQSSALRAGRAVRRRASRSPSGRSRQTGLQRSLSSAAGRAAAR